jgi:hypothetical protein
MQHHAPILFENIAEEILTWENYFALENIQVIAEGELVNRLCNLSNKCFVQPSLIYEAWYLKLVN